MNSRDDTFKMFPPGISESPRLRKIKILCIVIVKKGEFFPEKSYWSLNTPPELKYSYRRKLSEFNTDSTKYFDTGV